MYGQGWHNVQRFRVEGLRRSGHWFPAAGSRRGVSTRRFYLNSGFYVLTLER